MKAEPSRLIPRKTTETLEFLFEVGGHGIYYPHRLKKWRDTSPMSPT